MSTPRRVRDSESVLHDIATGAVALGLPEPPPEMERQVVDALDAFRAHADNPVRDLPSWRLALVGWLRGVASALAEDDLTESWRFPDDTWWDRGYYGTHRVSGRRFQRWNCTACGERVGAPYTAEHRVDCRVHASRSADDPWPRP